MHLVDNFIVKIRPVARQDNLPELALINEIKNYGLKILIIVSVLCVCVWGGGGGGGGGEEEDMVLDIILDEHLP